MEFRLADTFTDSLARLTEQKIARLLEGVLGTKCLCRVTCNCHLRQTLINKAMVIIMAM